MYRLICVLSICLLAVTGLLILPDSPIMQPEQDTACIFARIAARRAEGRGLFQRQGPLRRAARRGNAGGC